MGPDASLAIDYRGHERVERLLDVLVYYLEEISLGFDRWEEPNIYGPGMYLAVVVGPSVHSYADAMGDSRWPDKAVRDPFEDSDAFSEATHKVAHSRDGAVVVSVDGLVNRQLVRFRSVGIEDDLEYADWMGSRHMSALDISTRSDVIATVTLSGETGRITVFEDGDFETVEREALGGEWRSKK